MSRIEDMSEDELDAAIRSGRLDTVLSLAGHDDLRSDTRQYDEADLQTMDHRQIDEAYRTGRLDALRSIGPDRQD